MNKFIFFLLFVAVSLAYVFEVDRLIATNLNPFNSIKKLYIDTSISIMNTTQKYFYQATTIQELKKENEALKNYKILYLSAKNRLDNIKQTLNIEKKYEEKVKFAHVLSYINFDDFTKVWLDYKMEDSKILGLISGNFAAGIVVNDNNRAKALLNGNEKCNYAVFIGNNKAPGIVHPSKEHGLLMVKYIPIIYSIKEGDIVTTSGMDNTFFEGLLVGEVVSVNKMQDMQEALIKPYAHVLKEENFFIYRKNNINTKP
ncbi:MAG: rod shape-determining protein MreC [Halarcobacter sp.]